MNIDRAATRDGARKRLGVPVDRFLVAVMGGSLGSGVLNDAVAAYVAEHADDAGLAVRQVAGERFVDRVATQGAGDTGVLHQVVGYEADMASVYAAADLLVGRGGASTVHEVAVTGVPAILVPWSGAADDHQRGNVEWVSEVGGAVLREESAASELGAAIEGLRDDPAALAALSAAAHRRGDVHRSGALAELIERVAVTSTST